MTELFNRKAEMIILNPADSTARTLADLRVEFSIEKTSESTPNTSKISVYNMNEANRDFLETENLKIIFSVGYEGIGDVAPLVQQVFSGDVVRVTTEKKGPDFFTTLECGDSEVAIEKTHFDKSYAAGFPIWSASGASVIKDVIESLGVTINNENLQGLEETKFINGTTFSGPVKKILDDFVSTQGLEWSVQDGELHIRPPAQGKTRVVSLSKDTGLVGIPIRRENGIEFVSLMNPLIKPTETIKIESTQGGLKAIDGFFVVKRVEYKGDTREGEYQLKGQAIEVE